MKRIILASILVYLVLVLGNVRIFTYNDLNAGIAVSGFGHCVGLEVKGSPGVFVDVDCA